MRVVNMHYMEMAGGGDDASASTGWRRGFKERKKVSSCERQKQPVMVTKQREPTCRFSQWRRAGLAHFAGLTGLGAVEGVLTARGVAVVSEGRLVWV